MIARLASAGSIILLPKKKNATTIAGKVISRAATSIIFMNCLRVGMAAPPPGVRAQKVERDCTARPFRWQGTIQRLRRSGVRRGVGGSALPRAGELVGDGSPAALPGLAWHAECSPDALMNDHEKRGE